MCVFVWEVWGHPIGGLILKILLQIVCRVFRENMGDVHSIMGVGVVTDDETDNGLSLGKV